jgi:hypothetical protein
MITRRVVLTLPGMDEVDVSRGIEYRHADGVPLHFDLYRPGPGGRDRRSQRLPVVILVLGYSDHGARSLLGCRLKDIAAYDCWARLIACTGLAAVIYETDDPADDTDALYEYLKVEGRALGIDTGQVGVWSCSGNVPNALGFLAGRPSLRCAALCYGYTLDLEGSTVVADAAARFGFVTPDGTHWLDDLPAIPMLIVRAGADAFPGLNDSQTAFCRAALARDLPVRLIEHATGPHAFDIVDDSDRSRAVIREVLDFLRDQLCD